MASNRAENSSDNGVQDGQPSELSQDVKLDAKQMQFVVYRGMMMPQVMEPVEVHIPKVRRLQLRADDVLLCTYPKSGTHWVWRVLDMLVHGSADYGPRFPDSTMLDMMLTTLVDQAPSPRVLNTHLPFDLLPQGVKDGGVKVVHVYRHPKAVLASMFFQMQATGKIPDLTLPKLEAMVFSEKAPYKNQFYYFDKVSEFERDNPLVKIFHIAYEDMKQDTAGCVRKMADHLSLKASDELCNQIAQAVGFNKQKEQEEKLGGDHQTSMKFYRKGEADDWKNHLTVAQSERFDQLLRDRAHTCPFSRRYCPSQ